MQTFEIGAMHEPVVPEAHCSTLHACVVVVVALVVVEMLVVDVPVEVDVAVDDVAVVAVLVIVVSVVDVDVTVDVVGNKHGAKPAPHVVSPFASTMAFLQKKKPVDPWTCVCAW